MTYMWYVLLHDVCWCRYQSLSMASSVSVGAESREHMGKRIVVGRQFSCFFPYSMSNVFSFTTAGRLECESGRSCDLH